jgi:hypothetical protein
VGGVLGDQSELGVGLGGRAAQVEGVARLVHPTLQAVPARGVGEGEHADEQTDRGYRRDGQHDPPDVGVVDDVIQQGIDREGQHLPRDDHQLVDRDHASAALRGGHLGEIERARHRGSADAKTEDDPGGNHDLDVRGQCAAGGADQEQSRTEHQHALAADAVGDTSAQERAEGGSREQERAHDGRLTERAEVQIVLHVEQRAGDDARVVAEQQSAERGDHGQPREEPSAVHS